MKSEAPKKKLSILIVEDDSFSRAFVSEALKTIREYKVERHSASSCKEALFAFKANKPQIALVDIGLPDGDGFSLLKSFKETDPGCVVVMLTSSRKQEDVKRAMEMGAMDYIVKPFNTMRIQAILKGYLASQKL